MMKIWWQRNARTFWAYVATALALIIIWQIVSLIMYQLFWGTDESHDYRFFTYLVPSPKTAILSLLRDWEEISIGFGASAVRMIVSVLLAIVIGTPIGLIIGHEKTAERFLSPLLYITNPIPKVVLMPLLFVFFGVGNSPKIILITLLLVFPVMIAARDAAKNISKTYLLSVRSLHASRLQIYRHVILPACLPSILTTIRFSIGFAAVGLAITEAWNAKTGLWAYILNASRSYAYSDVFAGIVAFAILGLIVYALIDLIERIVCRWNYV